MTPYIMLVIDSSTCQSKYGWNVYNTYFWNQSSETVEIYEKDVKVYVVIIIYFHIIDILLLLQVEYNLGLSSC